MSDIKDLLKPRYKVIADYPGNIHPLGKIHGHNINGTINKMPIDEWIEWHEKYPANFKKLEWWEDRGPGEMPSYLKLVGTEKTIVYKVRHWNEMWGMELLDSNNEWIEMSRSFAEQTLPATETEYETQNK